MPIDPTATTPGLTEETKEEVTVAIQCRREGCTSTKAIPFQSDSSHMKMFRCASCRHIWGINVGGHINI